MEFGVPLVVLLVAETLDGREVETDWTGEVGIFQYGHFEQDSLARGCRRTDDKVVVAVHNATEAVLLDEVEIRKVEEALQLRVLAANCSHLIMGRLRAVMNLGFDL